MKEDRDSFIDKLADNTPHEGQFDKLKEAEVHDAELGRDDGTQAKDPENKPALDIKPKEEAQLLNEKSK